MSGNSVGALVTRAASGVDGDGNDILEDTYTVLDVIWWPGSSIETLNAQDRVSGMITVCFPTGTTVTPVDAVIPQILLDDAGQPVLDDDGHPQGDLYEIDGSPNDWPASPLSGWRPDFAVVCQAVQVTG